MVKLVECIKEDNLKKFILSSFIDEFNRRNYQIEWIPLELIEEADAVILDVDINMETIELVENKLDIIFVSNQFNNTDKEIKLIIDKIIRNSHNRDFFSSEFSLNSNDIMYLKSSGHYIDVVMKKGKYLLRKTMAGIEDELSLLGFIRTHSRYIVNVMYIESMDRTEILLKSGEKIPVSRNRLNFVKEKISHYQKKDLYKFTHSNI